jgi:type III pantothenate kinase
MDALPSILACDVGNSAVHFARVDGETVGDLHVHRLGDLSGLGSELYTLWSQMPEPRRLVASAVSPSALRALEAAVQETLGIETLVVGRDVPLPMPTELDAPQQTGADRLCAAVAAFDRLGVACVVADFGSAITIDYVDQRGVFVGGAILPGLRMGAQSLNEKTALLPEVEIAQPASTIGRNTRDAMLSGLIHGARGALRQLVEAYATEAGHWPLVIATGGDAALVCGEIGESDLVQAIVPDLAVRGVAIAYYKTLLDQANEPQGPGE